MNRFAIIATAILLGAVSCGKVESNTPQEEEPIDNPYMGIELSTKAEAFIRQGNTFAFRFLSQVDAASEGDYVVSPLSMQFLLGMILNGAQGTTADEICQVLGYEDGEVEAMNDFNPQLKYNAAQEDPYRLMKKSVRGGSWKDPESYIRSAWRSSEYQNQPRSYIGFRCVRSLANTTSDKIKVKGKKKK